MDDTAWPEHGGGVLCATDFTNDQVVVLTGRFTGRPVVAVTLRIQRGARDLPAPPAFPANYLGTLNPQTGRIMALPVQGVPFVPQGDLLFDGACRHPH